MNDTIKIVQSFEDSGLLIKGVTQAIWDEIKNKQADFLVCY